MKTTLLMVGTGGYARTYFKELFTSGKAVFELVGAVDPYAAQGAYYDELCARHIPIYNTVEEFYAEHTADVAVVVTPIYLHARQASYCLLHGSAVLCEKPICSTLEDVQTMIDARNRSGRPLAIGFQWSFNSAILGLKKDILAGRYGKIRRIRSIVVYPRDLAYYRRGTGWAGKRFAADGTPLFDSVAMNATAHYLHNMLFLTGNALNRAAEPEKITGEVYRVNPIEMFDTCALRVQAAGAELLFYATHAAQASEHRAAEFILEGTAGTARMELADGEPRLIGAFVDGTVQDYPNPVTADNVKLYAIRDALNGTPLTCEPETATPHLKCILALARLFPETPVFPEAITHFDEEQQRYWIPGLADALDQCDRAGVLPSEAGMDWAIPARTEIMKG